MVGGKTYLHQPGETDTEAVVQPLECLSMLAGDDNVISSVTPLLKAQWLIIAAEAQAITTQDVHLLQKYSGENTQRMKTLSNGYKFWRSELGCWDGQKSKKSSGWRHTYKRKRTTLCVCYLIVTRRTMSHSCRHWERRSTLDIAELRGLEFHQLMQDQESAKALGTWIQRLERRAFPNSNTKEFDWMLKGRNYLALLPKWQCKLGAPHTNESLEEAHQWAIGRTVHACTYLGEAWPAV